MTSLRITLIATAISLGLLATGCGGGTSANKPLDMGGADAQTVATLIEDINDAVGNPKKLDALFVKGSKPSDTKKMAKFSYTIVGKPSVEGSKATAKIRVDAVSGEKIGEVDWTFEKEGEKWKIKTAPVP